MTKIGRSWRIGCATSKEMNEVWRVLHDAGEPMLRDEATYTYAYGGIIGSRKGQNGWGRINASPNITFKEFMKIMKPKDKKEDVQYINNLLDYLDKPELIQHVDHGEVRALFYFPVNFVEHQMVVVFENGTSGSYSVDGKSEYCREAPRFFLKPKEKKVARGWRRNIIYKNGVIFTPDVRPTKEDFMKVWHKRDLMQGYGPWEEVAVEVNDE